MNQFPSRLLNPRRGKRSALDLSILIPDLIRKTVHFLKRSAEVDARQKYYMILDASGIEVIRLYPARRARVRGRARRMEERVFSELIDQVVKARATKICVDWPSEVREMSTLRMRGEAIVEGGGWFMLSFKTIGPLCCGWSCLYCVGELCDSVFDGFDSIGIGFYFWPV